MIWWIDMEDVCITFVLRWKDDIENILQKVKKCETEDDLLNFIQENMLISIE